MTLPKWLISASALLSGFGLLLAAACLASDPGSRALARLVGRPPEPGPDEYRHVVISMSASAQHTEGPCPEYNVTITADGTVTYQGISGVATEGIRAHRISEGMVRSLVDAFFAADYFSLQSRYVHGWSWWGGRYSISHSDAITTAIDTGRRQKSVYNFYAAPEALEDLQHRIRTTSGVDRYIRTRS